MRSDLPNLSLLLLSCRVHDKLPLPPSRTLHASNPTAALPAVGNAVSYAKLYFVDSRMCMLVQLYCSHVCWPSVLVAVHCLLPCLSICDTQSVVQADRLGATPAFDAAARIGDLHTEALSLQVCSLCSSPLDPLCQVVMLCAGAITSMLCCLHCLGSTVHAE